MRNIIFGAIGTLWGGGILLSAILEGNTISGSGPYAYGQMSGLLFAFLLLAFGIYSLTSSLKNRSTWKN
jgi:hypothetical protein